MTLGWQAGDTPNPPYELIMYPGYGMIMYVNAHTAEQGYFAAGYVVCILDHILPVEVEDPLP